MKDGNITMASKSLTLLEERQINWMFNYLLCSPEVQFISGATSILDKQGDVNKTLRLIANIEGGSNHIELLKKRRDQALIPEEEFKLINVKNERQCKWLNAYLVQFKQKPNDSYYSLSEYRKGIILYFDLFTIPNTTGLGVDPTMQTTELAQQACHAFISLFETSVANSKSLLIEIKNLWPSIYKLSDDFSWLDQKKIPHLKWAKNYIDTNGIQKGMSLYGIHVNEDKDLYGAIVTIFDTWQVPQDSKTLFIMHMKKAYNQKKQRDKQEGKKAYNFVLKTDVKDKLDLLAAVQDKKIIHLLEEIILKEYEAYTEAE